MTLAPDQVLESALVLVLVVMIDPVVTQVVVVVVVAAVGPDLEQTEELIHRWVLLDLLDFSNLLG